MLPAPSSILSLTEVGRRRTGGRRRTRTMWWDVPLRDAHSWASDRLLEDVQPSRRRPTIDVERRQEQHITRLTRHQETVSAATVGQGVPILVLLEVQADREAEHVEGQRRSEFDLADALPEVVAGR